MAFLVEPRRPGNAAWTKIFLRAAFLPMKMSHISISEDFSALRPILDWAA